MAAKDAPISLGARLCGDVGRSTVVAAAGAAGFAVVELLATVIAYSGSIRIAAFVRLALLVAALSAVLWLVLTGALSAVAVTVRLCKRNGEARGLWAPAAADRPGRLAAWLWALATVAAGYLAASTVLTLVLLRRFKEPQLLALLGSSLQLALIALLALVALLLARGLARLGGALEPRLGKYNFLTRPAPALALLALVAIGAVRALLVLLPQAQPLMPWRHLLATAAIVAGCYLGRLLLARRRLTAPRRRTSAAGVAAALLVTLLILGVIGANAEAKYLAVTASPPLSSLVDAVRRAHDFDGDGYGSLLGENDCGPFDASIHPGARDLPDNRIDENCDGRDFSFRSSPSYRTGARMAVPDAFMRDWNILLITVDTVRYDHTSFGGYLETTGRDTTPKLAEWAAESTQFTFAQAPSAGTMASIPAILTSKFFHSGIALDNDVKRGAPPRLKPQNVLISELLKQHGYQTGAILTHEYFNDWGMEQGFDTYDNAIGAKRDPFRVTSHEVTDRALAWISQRSDRKWFLWTHYIDPHGRYVAHPGGKSFGDTEEDLYDGELHYTDEHLGRLLANLKRLPGADRTIVILTSDHGDGFGEHGFINHGQALYRELLAIPLIIHIPDLPPRQVAGPVSPLDIVPTVTDLAGIDTDGLSFEGESLVPQLFYGRDATDRVVFAETNWPRPLRAAITSTHKLIYHLQNNVYELYDLRADPWEKQNLAHRDSAALEQMKGYLDDWLERVYYSRDLETNQAAQTLSETLLAARPQPTHPIAQGSFDDGAIEVAGFDVEPAADASTESLEIAVYFAVTKRPSGRHRLQLECWPADDESVAPSRSPLRFTADGVFATDRWRVGEFIRDSFRCPIPTAWPRAPVKVGLRMTRENGTPLAPRGATRNASSETLLLGTVSLPDEPAPANIPSPPTQ